MTSSYRSIDTENFSATSPIGNNSPQYPQSNDGNNSMSNLSSKKITQSMTNNLNSHNYDGLWADIELALNNYTKFDYNVKNNNGETILHLLAKNCGNVFVEKLLSNILEKHNVMDGVNIQDNNGNTMCHYVLAYGTYAHELIGYAVKHQNANLSIKNNKGLSVESSGPKEQKIFASINDTASDIAQSVLSFNPDTATGTDVSINKNFSESDALTRMNRPTYFTPGNSEQSNDYNKMMRANRSMQPNNNLTKQNGTTSEFVDAFLKNSNTQQVGGSKKSYQGHRIAHAYSDQSVMKGGAKSKSVSSTDASTSDSESSTSSSMAKSASSLAKKVNARAKSKKSELHDRAIERIMANMNVKEDVARVYKAILYNDIKNNKAFANASGMDKATELEKRASDKKILKGISAADIKKMEKIIAEKRAASTTQSGGSSDYDSDEYTDSEDYSSESGSEISIY